jgi:ribosome-associated protein
MDFQLKADFIELDNLLKVLKLAPCAAQAKQIIQSGAVKVNGQVENRIRRKLRLHDSVEFGQQRVEIV